MDKSVFSGHAGVIESGVDAATLRDSRVPKPCERALPKASRVAKVHSFAETEPRIVFAIIEAAGWPIWALLVASVIAVALIIERLIVLRREKIVPRALLGQVIDAYRKQGVNAQLLENLYQDSAARAGAGGRTAQSQGAAPRDEGGDRGRGAWRGP